MTPGVVSYLGVSGVLFGIGLAGVLLRRNPLIVLLSLEVMLNSVNLSAGRLLALPRAAGRPGLRARRDGRRRRRGRGRPRADRRDDAPRDGAGHRRAEAAARMTDARLARPRPAARRLRAAGARGHLGDAARAGRLGRLAASCSRRSPARSASSSCCGTGRRTSAVVSDTLYTWLSAGEFRVDDQHPGRPAQRRDAAGRDRRRLPDPRLLDRVHARRPRGAAVLRVPEPVRASRCCCWCWPATSCCCSPAGAWSASRSYLLIGYWHEQQSAVDAAKKAFVMNAIGDVGIAIAIFLIFRELGTVDYLQVFAGPRRARRRLDDHELGLRPAADRRPRQVGADAAAHVAARTPWRARPRSPR